MSDDLIKQLIEELQQSKKRENDQITVLQQNMKMLNKLLMGNGDVGLCERVRRIQASITPLWYLVSTIGIALAAALIKTFMGA